MARDLAEGNFEQISPSSCARCFGDPAAPVLHPDARSRSPTLTRAGLLRDGRSSRRVQSARSVPRRWPTSTARCARGSRASTRRPSYGVAMPRPDETRPWEFRRSARPRHREDGDERREAARAEGGAARPAPGRGSRSRTSRSARWTTQPDHHGAAARHELVDVVGGPLPGGQAGGAGDGSADPHAVFPRDHFSVVGFSTRARELPIRELPEVCWDMGDPFTNLQEGLMVAEQADPPAPERHAADHRDHRRPAHRLLRGERSCASSGRWAWAASLPMRWPMTLKQVRASPSRASRSTRSCWTTLPSSMGFVDRMTQINKRPGFLHQSASALAPS